MTEITSLPQMDTQINQGMRPDGNTDQRQFTQGEVKDNKLERENQEFFTKISPLMRDEKFLIEVAKACDEAYRISVMGQMTQSGEEIPNWLRNPLFSGEEESLLVNKPGNEDSELVRKYDKAQQKQAINVAGLYALVDGIDILLRMNKGSARDLLTSIINGSVTDSEKDILSIMAHTSWASGQPFRDRETRDVMAPWNTLDKDEQHKDMIQIVAVARVLSSHLD